MYGHRGFGAGAGAGHGVLGLIFLVVLIALAVVAIVALARMLRTPHPVATVPGTPLPRAEDSALAELRLRYARGDIDRDDFLSRLRDLGGYAPENPPPAATTSPSGNP